MNNPQTSIASVARYANGNRVLTVVGLVTTALPLKTSTKAAEPGGTRSTRMDSVQVVTTNGNGLDALLVIGGPYMRIGTKQINSNYRP